MSAERMRCPVCGNGRLVDVAFDAGDPGPGGEPRQRADSREVDTYSCGHEVAGASLADADSGELGVETRTSDEPVGDPARGTPTRRVVEPDR
jgi:hypothetical protein